MTMEFLGSVIVLLLCGAINLTSTQQCGRFSCHGDVGNLAAGRTVVASSTCGETSGEVFCDPDSATCSSPVCRRCKAGRKGHEYPSKNMIDSPFFKPHSWWQSSNGADDVTLTFNLETTFYFTHLIMLFRSPRPGAMTLEKSTDYGQTWQTYQYYARNCSQTFGMDDDVSVENAECTSRYSDPTPCHRGEVIYRVLNPSSMIEDPYSDQAKHLLKITNLRIRMWKPQACPACLSNDIEAHSWETRGIPQLNHPFTKFAVYDLIIRGTCFCNGHADTCVPFRSDNYEPKDNQQAVVHGKCICEHNTAGDHCNKCMPLYNDAPWRPGNGNTGEANPCQRCRCNGHASSCRLDMSLWSASNNRSGGVCQDCQHNTNGRFCERCKEGFFRRADSLVTDQDTCQECACDIIGSVNEVEFHQAIPCHPTTGQCMCKPGVTGRRCDRCVKGYWGLDEAGCKECLCEKCDLTTGACIPDYGDDIGISFVTSQEPSTNKQIAAYDFYSPSEDFGFGAFGDNFYHGEFRYPDTDSRFPDVKDMAAVYNPSPIYISRGEVYGEHLLPRTGAMEVTRHISAATCTCKEHEVDDLEHFCKMRYDYALKIRVRDADDLGTHAVLQVAVRKIIKLNKVKVKKGKFTMYPESWTIMGCTCPLLIPGKDYLVVGHEDPLTQRLMINVESYVKEWWNEGRELSKVVKKFFKKGCK